MTCDWCNETRNLVMTGAGTACPTHYPKLKGKKAHGTEVSLVTCTNCGSQVPPAFACIRCGVPLR